MKKSFGHSWAKFIFIFTLMVIGFFYLTPAFAQSDPGLAVPNKDVISSSIVTDKPFAETILTMVNYFTGFLGFLATVVFIYAGVLWVLNMGEEELITKAKKIMTYAVIGILIVLLSYTIVTFITSSTTDVGPAGSGPECQSDFDCSEGQLCLIDRAEGGARCQAAECRVSTQCPLGKVCYTNTCSDPAGIPRLEGICFNAEDCDFANGKICWDNVCQAPPERPRAPLECFGSFNCDSGEFCSAGRCIEGTDIRCSSNTNCQAPRTCDPSGFCRNPDSGSGSRCTNNTDCASNFVCNKTSDRCEFQGMGGLGAGGVSGSPAIAASEENLRSIEGALADLSKALETLALELNSLPEGTRAEVDLILGQGSLADKLGRVEDLLGGTGDPAVARILEQLLGALGHLVTLREELDELRTVMPESTQTIQEYDGTSEALNNLIDDPKSSVKLRRFETKYRKLRDLVRRFPVVQARIKAVPGEGNVPFTVTFDGLDSVDPTGGTISDYKWTYLDNQGSEISLGNAPVVVHEFAEANTYAVRLHASTSSRDENGYKTAMDGLSTVRIKANPPASQVRFRVNGVEVDDVHRVTIKEAQAGLIFDPSSTVAALGRTIQKYEWSFGDTASEIRSTPTTVIHTFVKPGEYFVKLVAVDSHGVKDQRVVKLLIKSLAADILINPPEGNVNTEYRFQGVTSRSDDGSITLYQWTLEDEKGQKIYESEEQSFFYKFDRPGEYRAVLSVTDVTGSRDNATETLRVVSRKPVANFTYLIPETNHPNRAEFDAITSYDPDEGDLILYSWDFDGDGNFEVVKSSESKVSYDYRKIGNYRVKLQVEDNFGQRDLAEKTLAIDSILSADIVLARHAVQVGEALEFTVKGSNANAYLWEFGDSETLSSEEKTVKHKYNRQGRYTVKLHFFDSKDNEGVDTATVLVGSSGAPVATLGYLLNGRSVSLAEDACGSGKDGFKVTRADSVLFSASESINTDGTNRLLSYDWKFSDGSRNNKKEFTHRFTDITRLHQCLELTLAVRDEVSGKVSPEDKVFIEVVNSAPTVTDFLMEAPQAGQVMTPLTVKLRAVSPSDSDGVIKRYRWWYILEGKLDEKLGVHSTAVPETEMVITASGQPGALNRYFFILEITDNDEGVFTTEERFFELSSLDVKNGPNLSPVAEFSMDKTTLLAGDTVTFVSSSYDPQGDPLSKEDFRWDFDGDGEFDDSASGPQVSRQYNTPGEYKIRLKVTHRGLSSSISKTVYVEPTQSLPQAAFTYTVTGTSVTFDSSNSRFDPNLTDPTLRTTWDFDTLSDADGNGVNDDDAESSEASPTFNYPRLDRYKVRLKVTDMLGMEGVVAREIDLGLSETERQRNSYHSLAVVSPDQPLTSLNVTVTPAQLKKGASADIFVSVINADNSLYFGKIFFEVIEGSGEITPNPVEAKHSKASAVFNATDPGLTRIRVRAADTIFGDLTEEAVLTITP